MPEPMTDRLALERFVVENDALQALETRIGRFNIFDALGVVHAELRHSNFLAWLLDPGESHGLGGLFLRAVLMDLLRQTPIDQRLFSPIVLDAGELRGIEVRREWRNIDLLITCDQPGFVIAIENKVRSGEHSDQLARYKQVIEASKELSGFGRPQYVFLTPQGDEPSEADWTVYSYADLHRVLTRVRAASGDQMGDDVRAFLDHYLRLIGSRFMDDPEIVELCKEIYKNHRQAIDLIVEHSYHEASGYESVLDLLQSSDGYEVFHQTPRAIYFTPKQWAQAGLPPRRHDRQHPRAGHWIDLTIRWTKKLIYLEVVVGPADDIVTRKKLIEAISAHKAETGLAPGKREVTDQWTRLKAKTVAKFDDARAIDEVKLCKSLQDTLDKWLPGLEYTTDVMREIVCELKPTD